MEIFGSNCRVFVRRGVGEQIISASVFPTVKQEGGGVMVLWLVTLSVIYLEFKAHLTSMSTTVFCSNAESILFELSGTIICFSTGQ